MKRRFLCILLVMIILTLSGCGVTLESKNEKDAGALPPMITINGVNFFANTMPIAELPDDFEYMGEITAEETNDTGLQGCKYYTNKYINSFDEFYVYQECGTPISENQVDNTQRQWAYVKWVREGFER